MTSLTSLRLLWRSSCVKRTPLACSFVSEQGFLNRQSGLSSFILQRGFLKGPSPRGSLTLEQGFLNRPSAPCSLASEQGFLNRQTPLCFNVSQRRGFFSKRKKEEKKKTGSSIESVDDDDIIEAPPIEEVAPPLQQPPVLVFEGTMNNQVYMCKHFSLFTSLMILGLQPVVLYRFQYLDSALLKSAIGGGLAFFFLATPILIHTFTRKYVLQITMDYESKVFEVTTYTIFLRKKTMKFKQSDITLPPTPLPFTNVYAKGIPLLVLPDGWKSRYAYDHFMLLEKPEIDWSALMSEAKSELKTEAESSSK